MRLLERLLTREVEVVYYSDGDVYIPERHIVPPKDPSIIRVETTIRVRRWRLEPPKRPAVKFMEIRPVQKRGGYQPNADGPPPTQPPERLSDPKHPDVDDLTALPVNELAEKVLLAIGHASAEPYLAELVRRVEGSARAENTNHLDPPDHTQFDSEVNAG